MLDVGAMTQAEIARKLGVSPNYVQQIRREKGFPEPVSHLRWDLTEIRRYLRARALRRHPGAIFCVTCGSEFS